MRTVLVLLLLANLTLFAYTRLDGGSGGEAVRLAEQVQPDKIKLLTPQCASSGARSTTRSARGCSPTSIRWVSAS
jgi:hypothetical protein